MTILKKNTFKRLDVQSPHFPQKFTYLFIRIFIYLILGNVITNKNVVNTNVHIPSISLFFSYLVSDMGAIYQYSCQPKPSQLGFPHTHAILLPMRFIY